jgi:hypothetical protein
MSSELRQRIQIVLAAAVIIAALRAGYILYERRSENAAPAKPQPALLNPDYYVVPKKLHPYDLKSAKQLTQQPVWVKEGYRYAYYPYDASTRRADFTHEAGLLLPIEKLEIKDVVTNPSPGAPGQRQVLAVFEKDAKRYAVPVGVASGDDYQIYSDEMFYIQDPRDLYKHWSADIWDSIGRHKVKLGMNEFQADFAIGMGIPESSGDSSVKTVKYPNGGSPIVIIYRNGKAAEIRPGT